MRVFTSMSNKIKSPINIDHLEMHELAALFEECREKLKEKRTEFLVDTYAKSKVFEGYSYILFEENGHCIGFNKLKNPGYVDDHVPEDVRHDYNDFIEILDIPEIGSCTYEMPYKGKRYNRIISILEKVGIKEMKQGWV